LLDTIKGKTIFFFEEYIMQNSLYAQALDKFNKEQDDSTQIYGINIPNVSYCVATRNQLLKEVGLDTDGIVNFVKRKLN